jgi:feruloyl esterase
MRHFDLSRPGRLWPAAASALFVAACGGGDDDAPAVTLQQTPTTCAALNGTTVAAADIGEASTGAVVTSATYVFATPDTLNAAGTAITQALPDHCRLLVDIKPVDPTAPTIKSQVNLPTTWNGKKLQLGGSGYNGTLVNALGAPVSAGPDMPLPLTRGYMTAGTDSGHQNAAGVEVFAFALNAEALNNFGYASYKKTHDVAVQLAEAYYGKKPTRSYYAGSSEGGREGMMMAQRYPNDFDAIISNDPVMNWSGLQTFGNQAGGANQAGAAWLGTKINLIHNTVLGACDSLDGIADGVVSNYKACKPAADAALAAIVCAGGGDTGANCLSNAQLTAVNRLHAGYTFTFPLANGMTSYAGWGYGAEALPGNWSSWVTGSAAPTFTAAPNPNGISNIFAFGNGYVRYFIAQNPNFNPLTYNPAAFQARVQAVSAIMDATNPDLSAYFRRGGKLILKEDLGDYAQSPYTGLNYYDAVVARLGAANVTPSFKVYVAPGLPHSSAGIAAGTPNAPAYGIPGRVDWLTLLDNWSEKGTAPPDQLTATLNQAVPPYTATASKPLCAYPLYPRFTGASPAVANLATSYTCTN